MSLAGVVRDLSSRLQRFITAREGVAAVEFAFIAPFLIFLYLGMAELCQAFMAQRRVEHVASTIADLTSQATVVTDSDLADVFAAGKLVISPFDTTTLQQRVTSVTADSKGVPKVDWSVGQGMTPLTKGATVALPTNLIAANESVIMSDVSYSYASNVKTLLPSGLHFSQSYYLRPRVSDQVTKG